MHDFMNEHSGAVEQQRRRKEEERLVETALEPLMSLVNEATIGLRETVRSSYKRAEKVSPIDPGMRSKEIVDQLTTTAD